MGTTMSFYQIKNQGFTREQLQAALRCGFSEGAGERPDPLKELLKSQYGEELLGHFRQPDALPSPMIAYRPDAAWLPFFEVNLCEGYIAADSGDARKLSEVFGAPVAAFSIFDSDVMFFSYADAAKEVALEAVKPNIEEMMEEFEDGDCQTEFPPLLTELCPNVPEETLRGIWDGDEVFADDRAQKLCEAMGTSMLYRELPEGAEAITIV